MAATPMAKERAGIRSRGKYGDDRPVLTCGPKVLHLAQLNALHCPF